MTVKTTEEQRRRFWERHQAGETYEEIASGMAGAVGQDEVAASEGFYLAFTHWCDMCCSACG